MNSVPRSGNPGNPGNSGNANPAQTILDSLGVSSSADASPVVPLPTVVAHNPAETAASLIEGTWPGTELPTGGDFPFEPRKGDHGRPKKLPGNQGYIDNHGNRWVKDHSKQWGEWDVQHSDRTHTNVGYDGNITHREATSGGGGGPSLAEQVSISMSTCNSACMATTLGAGLLAGAAAVLVFGT